MKAGIDGRMSSGRHQSSPSSSSSFLAGIVVASVAWWLGLHVRSSLRRIGEICIDIDDDDSISVENRIRELPSRVRWPWDTIRKRVLTASASFRNDRVGSGVGVGTENADTKPIAHRSSSSSSINSNSSNSRRHKTGPCIGSIFGLDVGGTLTKLVYFEQRPEGEAEAGEREHEREREHEHERGPAFKRSASMADLAPSSASLRREKAEALDAFYSFAKGWKDERLSYRSRVLRGDFHFLSFETRRMSHVINLVRTHDLHKNIREVGATGGGAHKYANDWERQLGIHVDKTEEMDSLVAGMQFVLSENKTGECYTFKPSCWKPPTGGLPEHQDDRQPKRNDQKDCGVDQWWTSRKVRRDVSVSPHNHDESSAYPYLIVSIGTGVSILRVDGRRKHERISGSTIGGGTYWGLCRLLTGSDSFADVLNLAMKGDPSKVDMMVGDIYGNTENDGALLSRMGLSANVVASSFGKLVSKSDPSEGVREEDLARALLLMVTNNIGQVAHLNARLHGTSRIYFLGTFLQRNTISQQRLAYAIDYWSQGTMEALFLEREGYFGALGAFLLSQGISENENEEEEGVFESRQRNQGDADAGEGQNAAASSVGTGYTVKVNGTTTFERFRQWKIERLKPPSKIGATRRKSTVTETAASVMSRPLRRRSISF